MKKLIVLSTLITATFSAQAAELYLYAGAGLKNPVEKNCQTI
ncbi:molybdate transport system substrate-binding protein [Pasteurella multocida]|nr:molybdate transport system substrate-binding protein [Pasteurella multocida]